MQVILSGRGVVLTPAFRAQVVRKVLRRRVGPRLQAARVLGQAEKFRRTARLVVRGARGAFSRQATASDLAAALACALAAVERQRATAKERRRARRRRSRSG